MHSNKNAPVCLFVYTRLEKTIEVIQALQNNFLASESELYIFSDGARNENDTQNVQYVRDYIKTVEGFLKVTVHESEHNKGLAKSIVTGVTQVLETNDRVIVLEDDIKTTPNFLDFMNQALAFYEKDDLIQSVNGYSLKLNNNAAENDVYFQQRTFPWGWGTWKSRWNETIFENDFILQRIGKDKNIYGKFNKSCGNDISKMLQYSLEGKNNSWYVKWVFNHFINNKFAVFPVLSKVDNIGFDNEGTHYKNNINTYVSSLDAKYKRKFSFSSYTKQSKLTNTSFLKYFKTSYKLWFRFRLLFTNSGGRNVLNEIRSKVLKKI